MQNKVTKFMNDFENCIASRILEHFTTLSHKNNLNTNLNVVREIRPVVVICKDGGSRAIPNDSWHEYGMPHILFMQNVPSHLPFDVFVDTGHGNIFVCIKAPSYSEDGKYCQVIKNSSRVELSILDSDYYITCVGDSIRSSWGKLEKQANIHQYITITKTMRFDRSE